MKAIVNDRYGSPDRLRIDEIERPAVEPDEVLVKVHAVSINPLDWHHLRGTPFPVRLTGGLRRPKQRVRGIDVAGRVEQVGESVAELRPGDEVFGWRPAALAEYVAGPAERFVAKPAALSFEEAAALPVAATTALQGLRDHAHVEAGQSVLVNGASGGVGTFAVQIAKAFGAEVTGVCSTRNVELVRSLGADHVVDYTSSDFTRDGRRYDVVLDLVGNRSLRELRRALKASGTLVLSGGGSVDSGIGPLVLLLRGVVQNRFVDQELRSFIADVNKPDLLVLDELVAAAKLKPVLDRTYSFDEYVAAFRHLESGRARGKIVITL